MIQLGKQYGKPVKIVLGLLYSGSLDYLKCFGTGLLATSVLSLVSFTGFYLKDRVEFSIWTQSKFTCIQTGWSFDLD